MTGIEQKLQKDSPSASITAESPEPALGNTKTLEPLVADANENMNNQINDNNAFESPPAFTFDADAAADVLSGTATFPNTTMAS
ncbi:hypothetical protein FB639_004467, partial [Coemansia asiatica]